MSPTKQLIVTFLEQNPQTSVVKLLDEFSISKQAMHRHLKELIEQGEIHKQGLPPRVYYSIKPKSSIKHNHTFDSSLLSDFVGSGSPFNYFAKKIKAKHTNCSITCFAIAGTPNGVINNNTKNFEVINEA